MDVIIVGAGITGLAAAISFRRCGHRAALYERSAMNNEIGAAINVPPNVGRFVVRWGLDPTKARFVLSQGMSFQSHTTLEEQACHDHSRNTEIYGSPLFYSHRVDLHDSLKTLATEPDGFGQPAKIFLKSEVVNYDPRTPSITLADGSKISADLVVAADGVHSIAVETITGKPNPPQPANHANCAYRFLIPTTELEADEHTRAFVEKRQLLRCRIFADVAARRRLVVYPCRDYEIVNFVGICYNDKMTSNKEDWHASIDGKEVLERFDGFHPDILAVISKAKEVKRWPLLYRPPIPTWHRGGLVLAGDAAHPMLPHHGQGGAQGIEDGLALGLSFCGATNPSEIERRLYVFEKIRRNRASSIQVLSNFGYDENVPEELHGFLDGHPIPKSMGDMVNLAYQPDVVDRTVKYMTELDPTFQVPNGFFPDQAHAWQLISERE